MPSAHNGRRGHRRQFPVFTFQFANVALLWGEDIASCEILSEEIAEDGNTAVVKAKITYGDGTTDDQKFKLVKNADGDWRLDAQK